MSKKKHRKIWDNQAESLMDAASFTGCTGLMPSKPLDDHRWDAYEDLVSMAAAETTTEEEPPDEI